MSCLCTYNIRGIYIRDIANNIFSFYVALLQIYRYCSKDCQVKDWKRQHKRICKTYADNMAPKKDFHGMKGAVGIGLYSIGKMALSFCICIVFIIMYRKIHNLTSLLFIGLIDDEMLDKAIFDRSISFFKEVKRVSEVRPYGFRKPTISLLCSVVYDMEKIRFSAAATLMEKGVTDAEFDGKQEYVVTVPQIIFHVVDDNPGEVARRKLHPPRGSGEISDDARNRVIGELYSFICSASQDHGVAIQAITFGRGLMWMKEKEFQDDERGGKMLEKANDAKGNMIMWMPDMSYIAEDMGNIFPSGFGL